MRDARDPAHVIVARNVKIPNDKYDFVRKKVVRPAYAVTAIVRGGSSCKGARGSIHKLLEQGHAWYSVAEGRLVTYVGNDLSVTAYFLSMWIEPARFKRD